MPADCPIQRCENQGAAGGDLPFGPAGATYSPGITSTLLGLVRPVEKVNPSGRTGQLRYPALIAYRTRSCWGAGS